MNKRHLPDFTNGRPSTWGTFALKDFYTWSNPEKLNYHKRKDGKF